MKRKWLLITVIVLILVTNSVIYANYLVSATQKPQERTEQSIATTTPQFTPPTVEKLLELTNAERAKVGVAPLVLDERLNQSAQLKADELVREGLDDTPHINDAGINTANYIRQIAPECFGSENLLANTVDVYEGHSWWMNSTPHANAIKNPRYDYVGFAIKDGFVVQHLCDIK